VIGSVAGVVAAAAVVMFGVIPVTGGALADTGSVPATDAAENATVSMVAAETARAGRLSTVQRIAQPFACTTSPITLVLVSMAEAGLDERSDPTAHPDHPALARRVHRGDGVTPRRP
jgi:hypothetical protein